MEDKLFKAFIILDLIDRVTKPVKEVKKSIQSIDDVRGVIASTGKIMLGLGAGAGAAAFGLAKTASEMQDLKSQFEVFLGSGEKAAAMLSDLKLYAGQTQFELPEVVTAGKQLLGFDFEANKVMPTIKKLANVSTALKIPIGDLTYLFGTLKSAGKATTMDLNQFAMRGIPIWKELEKATGLSGKALRKYVEQGQVDFNMIDQIFTGMTSAGGRYFGMVEKMSGNFSVSLSNVGDALKSFATMLGTPMLAPLGKLLQGFSNFLGNITSFVERHKVLNTIISYSIMIIAGLLIPTGIALVLYGNWTKITGQLAVKKTMLSKTLNILTKDIWKNITATKVYQTVAGGFKTGGMIGGIKGLAGAFGGLTMSIVKSSIAFLTSPIGLIIIAVVLLSLYIYNLVKNWDKFKESFTNIFAGTIDQFKRFKNNLQGIFQPIVDWFKKIFNFKFELKGLGAILYILGYMCGVFDVIFGMYLNNFGEIILSGLNNIIEGLKALFNGDIAKGFAQIFTGLFQLAAAPLIIMLNTVIDVINAALKLVHIKATIPNIPTELPAFANGVSGFQGGMAWINEEGPELVRLPGGSDVYSTRKSQQYLAERSNNGSGNTEVNNYYNIQTIELNPDTIEQLKNIVDIFTVIKREAGYAH